MPNSEKPSTASSQATSELKAKSIETFADDLRNSFGKVGKIRLLERMSGLEHSNKVRRENRRIVRANNDLARSAYQAAGAELNDDQEVEDVMIAADNITIHEAPEEKPEPVTPPAKPPERERSSFWPALLGAAIPTLIGAGALAYYLSNRLADTDTDTDTRSRISIYRSP